MGEVAVDGSLEQRAHPCLVTCEDRHRTFAREVGRHSHIEYQRGSVDDSPICQIMVAEAVSRSEPPTCQPEVSPLVHSNSAL